MDYVMAFFSLKSFRKLTYNENEIIKQGKNKHREVPNSFNVILWASKSFIPYKGVFNKKGRAQTGRWNVR